MFDFIRSFDYNQKYKAVFIYTSMRKEIIVEFITATETALKWGISTRRVHTLCHKGRIKGVTRLGNMWAIPNNASKPTDARIKSGRYVKNGVLMSNKEGESHGS